MDLYGLSRSESYRGRIGDSGIHIEELECVAMWLELHPEETRNLQRYGRMIDDGWEPWTGLYDTKHRARAKPFDRFQSNLIKRAT